MTILEIFELAGFVVLGLAASQCLFGKPRVIPKCICDSCTDQDKCNKSNCQ